jgi:hypothetical protein
MSAADRPSHEPTSTMQTDEFLEHEVRVVVELLKGEV